MTTVITVTMIALAVLYMNRDLLSLRRGRKPAAPTGKVVYISTPKSKVA